MSDINITVTEPSGEGVVGGYWFIHASLNSRFGHGFIAPSFEEAWQKMGEFLKKQELGTLKPGQALKRGMGL